MKCKSVWFLLIEHDLHELFFKTQDNAEEFVVTQWAVQSFWIFVSSMLSERIVAYWETHFEGIAKISVSSFTGCNIHRLWVWWATSVLNHSKNNSSMFHEIRHILHIPSLQIYMFAAIFELPTPASLIPVKAFKVFSQTSWLEYQQHLSIFPKRSDVAETSFVEDSIQFKVKNVSYVIGWFLAISLFVTF